MVMSINAVILDTPEAKIFHINVPEDDAIGDQAFTFVGLTMTSFNSAPMEKYIQEVTPINTVCTGSGVTVAISAISATAITFTKTSAVAAAITRVFRVYLHSRRFYQ